MAIYWPYKWQVDIKFRALRRIMKTLLKVLEALTAFVIETAKFGVEFALGLGVPDDFKVRVAARVISRAILILSTVSWELADWMTMSLADYRIKDAGGADPLFTAKVEHLGLFGAQRAVLIDTAVRQIGKGADYELYRAMPKTA